MSRTRATSIAVGLAVFTAFAGRALADGMERPLDVPDPIIMVQSGSQAAMPRVSAEVMEGVSVDSPITASEMSLQEVVVIPGINTIVPSALGHQNRIVTPFDEPVIQTVSDADIQVHQNVIYAAPKDERPVTMYISPKGDESVAISLTLAPQRIPPVQANLALKKLGASAGSSPSKAVQAGGHYSGSAKKWEESQPYMDSIRLIMRGLALGKVPQGYSLTSVTSSTQVPTCRQEGLEFSFVDGQWLQGHNFNVLIGVVTNTSNHPVLVEEVGCTHPHLGAVSIWPSNLLESSARTEVYVVTRTPPPSRNTVERPSLLGVR